MVLSKSFSVYKRLNTTQAVSVLLERRDKPESLLFESGAVAELGMLLSVLKCIEK
jgi:hypothetical protein